MIQFACPFCSELLQLPDETQEEPTVIRFCCPYCNALHEMPEETQGLITCHECQLSFGMPDPVLAARSLRGEVHPTPKRSWAGVRGLWEAFRGLFQKKCP
jgi:hypothetical protein